MVSRQLVPPLGFNNVLVDVDTDFVVVAHGKLASGQLRGRCLVSILESQLFVLFEDTLVAKEEPSTNTKGGFWNSLLGGQAVVM